MAIKFYETSHGGLTLFMVTAADSAEAFKRIGAANVPAGVNYYAQTVVVIVEDKYAVAVRTEFNR